jgi:pyruvate-ferredoxin/flavodoxin oxidoreductase
MGQVRYSSLAQEFPDVADKLFEMSEDDAKERYNNYKRLADGQ